MFSLTNEYLEVIYIVQTTLIHFTVFEKKTLDGTLGMPKEKTSTRILIFVRGVYNLQKPIHPLIQLFKQN